MTAIRATRPGLILTGFLLLAAVVWLAPVALAVTLLVWSLAHGMTSRARRGDPMMAGRWRAPDRAYAVLTVLWVAAAAAWTAAGGDTAMLLARFSDLLSGALALPRWGVAVWFERLLPALLLATAGLALLREGLIPSVSTPALPAGELSLDDHDWTPRSPRAQAAATAKPVRPAPAGRSSGAH